MATSAITLSPAPTPKTLSSLKALRLCSQEERSAELSPRRTNQTDIQQGQFNGSKGTTNRLKGKGPTCASSPTHPHQVACL